ncbi:MAG: phosphoglucosamine mutase, partial [Verrucomicrobiae bacterium]|nr:phosphoglucosamine mutase [Verrucomicrobiae bacterium]
LIFREYATTGDGLVAALQLLRIMKSRNALLSQLVHCWTRFPQKLANVQVRSRVAFEELDGVMELVAQAEQAVAAQGGRVFLRYSGTEPKARLLIEARDEELMEYWSTEICGSIQRQIGA